MRSPHHVLVMNGDSNHHCICGIYQYLNLEAKKCMLNEEAICLFIFMYLIFNHAFDRHGRVKCHAAHNLVGLNATTHRHIH